MEPTKIVVRYLDGRVLKGFTSDLLPNRDVFHVLPHNAPPHSQTTVVPLKELKAVFVVKDFVGHPEHHEENKFQPGKPPMGKKLEVIFKDGEHLVGTTQAYQPGRPTFYLIPADPASNIERCLIITSATKEIKSL